jgi:competence protein ComEA
VFLSVLLGLLAFRGYGNRLGARPTDPLPGGSTRIDLNTADRAELEQIPGIGPERAKAIEDHRNTKGRFRSVDELRSVSGFGPTTVEKARPYVWVEPVPAPAPNTSPGELEPAAPAPVPERKASQPSPAPRPAAKLTKIQPGDPPINVNVASAQDLERLPGVGPVMAQNIVAARPFKSVDDLDRVKGIGPKTLGKIRPFVVVK